MHVYAIHDSDRVKFKGAIPVESTEHALELNQTGWGIFDTVNHFKTAKIRTKEEGSYIIGFYADIDGLPKNKQIEIIKMNLLPTRVNESKNGYHVFWDLAEPLKLDDNNRDSLILEYETILKERVAPNMKSDKKATDFSRVLRKVGFNHMKNPNEPFMIKNVLETHTYYDFDTFSVHFPYTDDILQDRLKKSRFLYELKEQNIEGDSFFEKIWNLDQMEALKVLSGTEAVGMECFDFRRNSKGTYNIIIDGKGTSCWIDLDLKIGSSDKAGPTVFQWINWYHKNNAKTVAYIKQYFPELN